MSPATSAPVRKISVVVPMRNEAHRVDGLVDDLAAQDFAGDVEIFVADGDSSDGSPELLVTAAERAGLEVTIIGNPERTVAPGLNACIERANGDLIVRLDLKARYPSDYLRRCALAAEETGAWNVGGLLILEGETTTERAVACAMDTPFGGIHWTRHVNATGRTETDTVYCGAFRPEALARVGRFAELGPDHDEEYNLRIRRAGGRVVFDPSIRAFYTGRRSYPEVFRQYHDYGLWKVPVMLRHRRVLSARSLVPSAFVASLAVLAPVSRRSSAARRLLATEVTVYSGCALVFAAASIRNRGERWSLLPRSAAVFPTFHVAYGLGMLRGAVRAARDRAHVSATSRSRSGRSSGSTSA